MHANINVLTAETEILIRRDSIPTFYTNLLNQADDEWDHDGSGGGENTNFLTYFLT
jgi:hypothetical protein